ncbi:hypothetical protein FRX31_003616 [Thalictrum thalictroides]|uniref:Uncharacterized protein n=1 Tax=Thalictrum thalictroides TaxID=46969 RepID=A0A7J6XEG6_THATH|nr:hypothetical protein FRX31_003616 [Thalictrum thalictroides]
MHRLHQSESFVIQIKGEVGESLGQEQVPHQPAARNKLLNSMKLFNRFRKILMRFVFSSLPSVSSTDPRRHRTSSSQHGDGRPDTPKTSCSSSYYHHYSSNSHYNEAIADCIEFCNRSSQGGTIEEYSIKSSSLVAVLSD